MKLNTKRTLVSLSLALCVNASFAGNTLVNGVAPRAQSMQAFVAVADDPSAIFYNPAGITQVKGSQVDAGLSYIIPYQSYSNSSIPGDPSSTSTEQVIAPNLFFTSDQLVKSVTLGFGLYAPFARRSNYTVNAATYDQRDFSDVTRLDFAPTLAFDVNKYMSVGLGPVISRVMKRSSVLGLYQKGNGSGYTGQAGVLFKLPHAVKLGFSYMGREHARVTGNGEMGTSQGGFLLFINFPAVWRAGISWEINNQWLVSAGYEYEEWSYFKGIKSIYTDPAMTAAGTVDIDGKNSSDVRLGLSFKPSDKDEILAGYTYAQAAIPADNIVPAQPDYNAHYFSVGYSRYMNAWRFDVGYELGYMPRRNSNSPVFPGDYHMYVSSILLGISYNFDDKVRTSEHLA